MADRRDERPTDPVPALDPLSQGLLTGLRTRMGGLTPSQRVYVMATLLEDYCRSCGSEQGWACQCENDE